MSGPKVVRIVTRDEILAICGGQLARVDAALAEWQRIGRRNDCVDDAAIAAATSRRAALAALIAADRFIDLQKQAPREEAFLRDDLRARLTVVAAVEAQARSKERRDAETGTTLLRTLTADGRTPDAGLRAGLQRGDAAALAAGFDLLSQPSPHAQEEVRRLAGALRDGEVPKNFRQWVETHGVASDPVVDRLEERIAQLAQLAEQDRVETWRARLVEAAGAAPARRGLLLDGVEIDTGRALTAAKLRNEALTDLHLTLAELAVAGLDATAFLVREAACDVAGLKALEIEARTGVDAYRAKAATAARRDAVLSGLAAVGYEVAEGMSTAWVREGRLVVRSATRPDYGVEVSGMGDSGQLQLRPVALTSNGAGPDPARDRDAETIWCGDVSALRKTMDAVGSGMSIVKALPIGATPLKRVEAASVAASPQTIAVSKSKARILR